MSNEIKLEVYTFRIRPLNSEKIDDNYLPLNNYGNDFWEFLQDYLAFLDTISVNDKLKKAIRLKEETLQIAERRRIVRGIFDSGGYGIESDIFNLTNNKLKFKKTTDDVDIMPFYFLFYVPRNRDVGIVIIERIGIFGISTILKDSLYKFFRNQNQNYAIDFSPLISKELAQTFLSDGGVKEIILRKYSLPEDRAEILGMKEYYEDILSLELRIKAKKWFHGFNNKINNYLKDPNGSFFDIPELQELGFENFNISVKTELDGTTRTVDLSETMQIRPYYNIDSEVEKVNGHPTFTSIDDQGIDLLNSLLNESNVKV